MRHRTPHPVRGAYDFARTDIPCPNCGAEPYAWCIQDNRPRHVPCIARLEKRPDSEGPDTPPPVVRIARNVTTDETTERTP